jgi:hypothetical protein
MIKLNDFVLNRYRNGSQMYKIFCFNYIKYILSDYVILEFENSDEPNAKWEISTHYIDRILTNHQVRNLFKLKFSSGLINKKYYNHIVLFTKVRDYDKNNYNLISKKFYNKINEIENKIILIGERKIVYNEEYKQHGENKIYSLYDDFMTNINHNKIIDLTQEGYTENNFNLESIINDLTLISNSKQIIMVGNGGFWCTSLFTDKLLSLSSNTITQAFDSEFEKQIFFDSNKFINTINYV